MVDFTMDQEGVWELCQFLKVFILASHPQWGNNDKAIEFPIVFLWGKKLKWDLYLDLPNSSLASILSGEAGW